MVAKRTIAMSVVAILAMVAPANAQTETAGAGQRETGQTLPTIESMTMEQLLEEFHHPPYGMRLPTPQRRIDVINSLRKIGDPLLTKLSADLADSNPQVRIAAEKVLASLGNAARGAVPELVAAMSDENEEVRIWAVRAVSHLKDPRAFYPLIKAARDPSPRVRNVVIHSAFPSLSDACFAIAAVALSDEDRGVRRKAIYQLQMLKDQRAVPLLIPLLDDTKTNSYYVNRGVKTPDRNCDRAVAALEYIVNGVLKGPRPEGTEEENDRKVNQWRQWWKENGEEFVRELYAEPELRRSLE